MKKIIVLFVAFLSLNVLAQQNQEDVSLWRGEPFGTQNMSKEIVDKRDEFSKHFDKGDGQITAHIASGPIHYEENGEWKTIYHTISPSANGFENIHNSFKTYYPATATGEIKTILPNGGTISDMISMKMYFEANGQKINVQSIKNAPGQASFNELTYTNAYGNGIDLRLTQNTTKRKMDYIIHSLDALGNIPSNVNNLVFEESVALPTGWKAVLENNEILLIDERGAVQAKYEKPIFEDAPFTDKTERNNEKAVSAENTDKETISELSNRETIQNVNGSLRSKVGQYEIVQNGNILTIKTLVEVNWLTSEDRVFPLIIDPTINVTPDNSNKWTGYIENLGCTNPVNNGPIAFNDNMYLGLGVRGGYYRNLSPWSKFNTSSITDCATINSASLNSYVNYDYSYITDAEIRGVANDPVPAAAGTITNDIIGGSLYAASISYNSTGLKTQTLNNTAVNDIESNLTNGWFALGYKLTNAYYCDDYVGISGYSSANKPYVIISYTVVSSTAPTSITSSDGIAVCSGQSTILTSTGGTDGINAAHVWSVGSCPQVAHIETFSSAPSSLSATVVNSITNGILNVTSTSADPMIHMPNIGTFPAATYKYINIRYKTTSNTGVQIYYSKNTTNSDLAESQQVGGTYINDGNWHILSINMSSSPNWTGNIYGWRFDWATTSGATVEIDFIELATHPVLDSDGSSFITVAPTATTEYYARKVDNCGTTSCASITIHLNESSTPPTASTGGGNYCHGNHITLTQSGGIDGTDAVNVWYAASGQTSPDPNSCNNEGFIELWNDFKYNDPNCYYNHHSTDYNVNNGILEVDVTGPDPFIWMYPLPGNVTIDADEYKYINVRYRVTNYVNNGVSHQPRMGVLFTKREHCDPYGYPTGYYPFSDSQYEPGSERKEINADGQWHIVSIPINNSANWHGTITGLRLDYFDPYPHEGNIGSSMEIDFLIVSKHPMIGEGKSITLSPGDEYYPTETTTYYAKKIDNCGATLCVDETVVLPPIGTTLSNNNESATCVVNANEFIHFYHTSGRFLGSINANGGNLGNVTMTTFVGAPAYMEDCNQPGHSSFHTAYMGRRWIMNSDIYTNGSDFGNNVSVRLPYNNSELVALNNFAQTDTPNNPFDGGTIDPSATRQNMMLTKITGATEDGNATQADCASTIRGIPNGGNGINPQGIANTQYIDFSIQQFSEFFLHKHQDNSPLPVELTNLSASCNKEVQINWTTASEKNSERFVVEKSRDGQTWTFVSEEQAAGNSTTTVSYTIIDTQPSGGISYYRLRQIDFDGEEEIFGPISVSCDGISNSMVVYPNPNDGTFVVEITSSEEYKNSTLEITDITGRLITTQNVDIVQGTNSVLMDNRSLVVGTYIVNIRGIDGSLKPVKVIVR